MLTWASARVSVTVRRLLRIEKWDSSATWGDRLPASPTPSPFLSWFLSGTLADGKVFDSSRSRGKPFKFKIGHQEVIRGWEEGVAQVRSLFLTWTMLTPEKSYIADITHALFLCLPLNILAKHLNHLLHLLCRWVWVSGQSWLAHQTLPTAAKGTRGSSHQTPLSPSTWSWSVWKPETSALTLIPLKISGWDV